MLKEPKGKYKYRCVFCDEICCSNDPRAVLYCEHDNGLQIMMAGCPPIKFKTQRLEA